MDELKSRIANLNPNPPLYKGREPETWSSLCATVGNVVNVTELIRTYGAQLVRDIKQAQKIGGIYEDIHPHIAARYKTGAGSTSRQNEEPVQCEVPWFALSDNGYPLRAGASTKKQQLRSCSPETQWFGDAVSRRCEEGVRTHDDWIMSGSLELPALENQSQNWIGNVSYNCGTGPYDTKPVKRMKTA